MPCAETVVWFRQDEVCFYANNATCRLLQRFLTLHVKFLQIEKMT